MKTVEESQLTGQYEDFIAQYDNAYNSEFCDEVIKAFDYYHGIGSVFCENQQFPNSNAGRFDWAIDLLDLQQFMKGHPMSDFNDVLFETWQEYTNVYGHLKSVPMYSINQKVQKTPAGGGYHIWHDEQTDLRHSTRCMVWMVYLNDNFEGGETEFLYYHKRIKPEKGKLLLWPAGYTHAHRGGLVTDGTKYIITGWFYLAHAPEID